MSMYLRPRTTCYASAYEKYACADGATCSNAGGTCTDEAERVTIATGESPGRPLGAIIDLEQSSPRRERVTLRRWLAALLGS